MVDTWRPDVFVTKLNPSGTALIYSTYAGGTEAGEAAGNSTDFPTTAGALDPGLAGGYFYQDAFLFQLDPSSGKLLYSTYIGGTADDQGTALAVYAAGDVYVAGTTYSSGFAVRNALQLQPAAAIAPAISTYLWGSYNDSASAVALDATGNVYLTTSLFRRVYRENQH
jgi:hypothetical protein